MNAVTKRYFTGGPDSREITAKEYYTELVIIARQHAAAAPRWSAARRRWMRHAREWERYATQCT